VTELELSLVGDSAAAPAAHIVEGLTDAQVRTQTQGIPHTIYDEVWHMAFWQQVTLDWVAGIETPFPNRPSDGFPSPKESETWEDLRKRFLAGTRKAAASAADLARLDLDIRCPTRPGKPVRIMSIRDQLISLAAHNSYHLGRIVVLRQLQKAWPPASGGFSW
jgi:hypothetical protein